MPTFFLRTKRLRFRLWTNQDIDLALQFWIMSDPLFGVEAPINRIKIEKRLSKEITNYRKRGVQLWPVFNNKCFVGCCGLHQYKHHKMDFELILSFCNARYEDNYFQEAFTAVKEYAKKELPVKRLFFKEPIEGYDIKFITEAGFLFSHAEYSASTTRFENWHVWTNIRAAG